MNTKSQEKAILEYLQKGNSITPLGALHRFNCLRLGARCYDLRRKGYPIKTELHKTPTGKIVAQYSLPEGQRDK